jgi:hypothetical protein
MLSCIWDTATSVIRDPTYIRVNMRLETCLLVRPTLDAKDVRLLRGLTIGAVVRDHDPHRQP